MDCYPAGGGGGGGSYKHCLLSLFAFLQGMFVLN